SGNIALKTIEGTASSLFSMIKDTFMSSMKTKLAAGLIKNDLKGLKDKLDYSEYGGAALFGLAAPVVKAHGSSNSRAIFSAIKQTCNMVDNQVIDTIKATIESMQAEEGNQ